MGYKKVVLTEKDNSIKTSGNMQEMQTYSPIMKQLDKFDTSYNAKKLNELYTEFDNITFGEKSTTVEPVSKTFNDVVVKQSEKTAVSFKTKLALATALVVTLLLIFLAIYNIFVINGLNKNINILQQGVSSGQTTLDNLMSENANLKNEETIKDNIDSMFGGQFGEMDPGNVVEMPK